MVKHPFRKKILLRMALCKVMFQFRVLAKAAIVSHLVAPSLTTTLLPMSESTGRPIGCVTFRKDCSGISKSGRMQKIKEQPDGWVAARSEPTIFLYGELR